MIKKIWWLKLLFILSCLVPIGTLANPYSNIYIIGDSLSDQGNLFQATLSLTGTGIPADDHYFMGRFSNGENYAGKLAEKLGLFLSASLTGGTNYAFGGARTDYNIVENPLTPDGFAPGTFPWTLNLQRQAFVEQGINDSNALYIVFSGSNDIGDLIGQTLVQGFEATEPISDQVVQGIRNVIEAFIAAGARDILVPNIPDLGIVPRVFNRDPLPGLPPDSTLIADTATALTIRFNNALEEMLSDFTSVNIIRFDTFSFLREVVDNPTAFGLTNSTQPCYTGFVGPANPSDSVCDDPESFLFWDNEHPTTAFHAILADQMLIAIIVDQLNYLRQQVTGLGFQEEREHILLAKLGAARIAIEDANKVNDVAAISTLQAFIHVIEEQLKMEISREEANMLITHTQQIMQMIKKYYILNNV